MLIGFCGDLNNCLFFFQLFKFAGKYPIKIYILNCFGIKEFINITGINYPGPDI